MINQFTQSIPCIIYIFTALSLLSGSSVKVNMAERRGEERNRDREDRNERGNEKERKEVRKKENEKRKLSRDWLGSHVTPHLARDWLACLRITS